MKFVLKPILSEIKELYHQPISGDRFKDYLAKLQGESKNDFALPIAGFNPMAKEHVIKKIVELENLEAEQLIANTIELFNNQLTYSSKDIFTVVLNLADDLLGAWTNFYTTDFDSKFKLNAFVTRNFCTPYFYTSENFSKELIITRTNEYLHRTMYWLEHGKPKTLEDHVVQESHVATNSNPKGKVLDESPLDEMLLFYESHKSSEEYDLIFNFFYGDGASESLAYKQYGIKNAKGFEFASFLASRQ